MAIQRYTAFTTVDVTLVTTTEAVAITVSGVATPRAGCKILISGWCQVNTGTNTTSVTPRVRRGTAITDPALGDINPMSIQAPGAPGSEAFDFVVEDAPGDAAGLSYSLTIQQVAATANGAVIQAQLTVDVIS
jgi:hypothetical protein